jgi:hypothetical protein
VLAFGPLPLGDVRLSHSVIARMVCADHAHVLTGSYRPAEMLGLMEYLDLVIAMRLHVLVFAAVAGTPLFPLSYGAKVTNFIDAGEAYDIPLRCLLPRGVEGILTAGRCISGTHEAHSSYRVTPTAMATGQAAGVCAGLASARRQPPRAVPAAHVQAELLRQGADLGEEVPSRSRTR